MRSFKAALAARMAEAVAAVLILICALWCVSPAHAMTLTAIGETACNTSANTCSTTATGSVASGGTTLVVATVNYSAPTAIVVSDSAGNCSSAYTTQTANMTSGGFSTTVVAWCTVTSAAITSGTTTFTMSYTGTAEPLLVAAYSVTGNAQTTFFDQQATKVTGQWTSGTAVTGSTSPALAWSSEDAIVVTTFSAGATTDSIGTYTGGYASANAFPATASNRPEMWVAKRTVTSGTAQVGFTPTLSASKYGLTQIFMFVNSGALSLGGRTRMLMGVGQ